MNSKLKRRLRVVLWMIAAILGILILYPLISCLVYPAEYVFKALGWGEASVYDYQKLPSRSIAASDHPFYFEENLQEEFVRSVFEADDRIENLDSFLAGNHTQAFIVIKDDRIIYERYFNGTTRDSIVTSFSAAKSFDSAMVGAAIADGYIGSVNDPITNYLPELERRDTRFGQISIRDLLMMSSGIHYLDKFPLLNDDGTKTYLFPNLRQLALADTHITGVSGKHFQYNNYHPLLLGLILERVTGKPVAEYLQERIWQPAGMEFDASWSLDDEEIGFEKMESGINARAIDFAKFGCLYLHLGNWNGSQILPEAWVLESTREDPIRDTPEYYGKFETRKTLDGYYQYFWWGLGRENGEDDYSAYGNFGQFIYISPQARLVIVRNGEQYGIDFGEWMALFFNVASQLVEVK